MRVEPKSSIEAAPSNYEKIACIIDALGEPDALKIFDAAATEFESGKTTLKKLQITPRKYYRNLKKLNDSKLIEHSGNKFKLSPFGELVHKMLFNEISTYLIADQKFFDQPNKTGSRTDLTLIDNYKDLIKMVVATIEKATSEIMLATRYLDMTVIQSIIFAIEKNVKIRTITSEKLDYSGFLKLLSGFVKSVRPNALKFIIGRENSYRSGNIPMSFIVIDNEIAVFEIPNIEFKLAFVSTDKKVVNILSRLFQETWTHSKTLHLPGQ